MKKALFLIGSPRKNGNTTQMVRYFIDALDKTKNSIETIRLNDSQLEPCIACDVCKTGDLVCNVKDDMKNIYSLLEESDVLVFGTPIYWFGPTAQMKLLIDRLRPFYYNKKLRGKQAALLLPAGSGEGDCDLCIQMFRRIFSALEIKYLDAVTARAYDIGDIQKLPGLPSKINGLIEKSLLQRK